MKIFIIQCDNERIAISDAYGWIEVECLYKGEPTAGKIFDIIHAIGSLDDKAFGGPDWGDIFEDSICEFYRFQKVPLQKKIEFICGEQFKKSNEFKKINKDDEIFFLKTEYEKCYLSEIEPCYMAQAIGCQNCSSCYYQVGEKPIMSFEEMINSKRYYEVASDKLHIKALLYHEKWG